MFGYIATDFPNVFVKDTVLYRASYCGLCKGIGKCCGNGGRFTLSYDFTFLSVFLHNVAGLDFEIKKQNCILHLLKKRPVAIPDNLTERLGALNVILSFYKLTDDVIDESKGAGKRFFFKAAYRKAKGKEPLLSRIVNDAYAKLRELERSGSDSVDMVSDVFATMTKDLIKELLGEKFTENVGAVAYNLGKWIYLIDALDDYDKDKKSGSYNVFIKSFGNFADKKAFITEKRVDLESIFGEIFYEIFMNGKEIPYKFNHDLIDNILYKGLRVQTKCVMEGNKCASIMKF